jgi:uncharacterized protein (TIGR00661 family)
MRILYGVVGEGMGHATRSSVVLKHLVASRAHAIEVVVSGRAHAYLQRTFPGLQIHEIAGLNMIYKGNRVKRKRTFWDFVKKLPAFAENFDTFVKIGESFRPELVISDFESFAYYYAKQHDLPVISIDNMQIINRCRHDGLEISDEDRGAFELSRAIVKAKLPGCDWYLITTFFFPEIKKKRTSLHPPILRDAILDAQPSEGEHVIVYQTSDTNTQLVPMLKRLPGRFLVYGMLRTPGAEAQDGNVTLRGFSEAGFVRDLAAARAVVAGGGFSLMGEAVELGKPMLSVPLEGQFEQTLNALYLAELGYGEHHRHLSEDAIASFLYKAPRYAEALNGYRHRGDRNRELLGQLDALIARIASEGRLVG